MHNCKLLFGIEGSILQSRTGTFSEMDVLSDNQLQMAMELLKPGGDYAGKTFITILIHENGSLAYSRHYTVSY